MKGFILKSMALTCLAAGLPMVGGCYGYRELVDPCYPERWNQVARDNVNRVFDEQALNGHILDQTIWNFHFTKCWVEVPDPTRCNCVKAPDIGPCDPKKMEMKCNNEKKLLCIKVEMPTYELNFAGKKKLEYLVQRIPGPDGRIYMQTARDLPVGIPQDKLVETSNQLNIDRVRAIKEYVAILSAGYQHHPVAWEVAIHDRPTPDQPALPNVGAQRPTPVGSLTDLWNQYLGSIPISPIFGGSMGGGSGGAP